MATNFMNVTSDQVKDLAEQMKRHNPDRTLCLSPFTKIEVYGPTKKRKTHKFKFEIEIPDDAIVGDGTIIDFGGFAMIDIATKRIDPKFLSSEK